uniref:PWWP domain containing 3A, DNA repair factor n=1 Tax=Loxodonta africana TaxID=9785 RepID=G3TBC6_LOXAF
MMDAKYVLCRWKKRLWPAKVLARTERSTKNKRKKEFFLDVQILSLDEKMKVKSTGVEILKKSRIEDIASLLASQNEALATPLQELTYRRSLRVALDVLNEGASSSQESPSREEREALSPSRKPTDSASSLCGSDSATFHHGDTSGSPRAGRRGRAQHSRLSSPTPGKDLKCPVESEQGPGCGRNPEAPPAPPAAPGCRDGSRSQTHRKAWTCPRKRERNSAQTSSLHQDVPSSVSGREEEKESEEKAGSPPDLASPSNVREDEECARADGGSLVSPAGPLPALPASRKMAELPAKRRRLGGRQRPCVGEPGMGPAGPVLHPRQGPVEQAPATHTLSPHFPDPEEAEEEGRQASEGSVELGSLHSILDEDEDEEPPRILLYHEPRSFEVGMLVWLKYQKYPFWPAVVKSLRRRDKKASVLFIEGNMNPKGRGITVSLRRLKHFDCKEKQTLLDKAKQDFEQDVGWCVSLITDYRVRLGCGSFSGSFLEYYAAAISYPVRKSIQQDVLGARFPQLSGGDPEEPEAESPLGRSHRCRKVLPDRSRAARDRANQKLVEYIVKAKGAESHLRAILKSRKPSRWLKTFLNSGQYVTCVETYLEDEEQLDLVVKYLQGVYQETGSTVLTRVNGDRIRFILDVLLPEAIICAISAVDAVDYKTAEEKYIKGPSLSYREKEIFDNQVLEERSRRHR